MAELNEELINEELLNYISVRRLRDFYLGLKDKLNKIEDMPDLGKLLITLNEDGVEKQFLVDRDEYTKPAKPTFSPSSGTYSKSKAVTISTTTSDATIRYTMSDTGAPPADPTTTTGTVGTSVTLNQDTSVQTKTYMLKAIAVKNGLASDVSNTITININRQVETPSISQDGDDYDVSRTITITCTTTGATIYYTTDGSTPTTSSSVYDSSNKPTISSTTTIKAIAVVDNTWVNSEVASKTITASKNMCYIGQAATLTTVAGIKALSNSYHEDTFIGKPEGTHKINFGSTAEYVWFCLPNTAAKNLVVKSSGFDVPLQSVSGSTIENTYRVWRTAATLKEEFNFVFS